MEKTNGFFHYFLRKAAFFQEQAKGDSPVTLAAKKAAPKKSPEPLERIMREKPCHFLLRQVSGLEQVVPAF